MKIYNNIFKWSLLAVLISFSSCETMDLEQTENPSTLSQAFLDPTYTFNYVQLQLPDFVNSANSFSQEVTRQMAMTGGNTYDNAFAPVNFNGNWNIGYNMLNAIKIMEPKAVEYNQNYALGASKVIRAYVIMTMVDMYGDIPFSESLQGNANLNPKFDKSQDIYKQLLLDIDDAIRILKLPNSGSSIQDLYYTKQSSWITLANTLKLKMYSAARLEGAKMGVSDVGAAIAAVITEGDYIDTEAEDFAFKYGNSRFTPNTRHPLYNDQYEAGGGAYIGNYMMWAMTTEKGFPVTFNPTSTINIDPRTNYYFYRQAQNPAQYKGDTFTLPGRSRPSHFDDNQYKSFYNSNAAPYVVSNWIGETSIPDNGFWGRDHGDNSGIPPDSDKRTVGGIYPIGGAFGKGGSVQTNGDKGALGAGIMPIILSSFVHFMIAEDGLSYPSVAALKAPITELEAGIRASIKKTINLVPTYSYIGDYPSAANLASQETFYVGWVLNKYSLPATNKLELIVKEYYLASWGNGIEPYNNYRRTGYPSNFQPTLEPAASDFYSTAMYPGNSVVNNPNHPTNVGRTKKVFWDSANIILH